MDGINFFLAELVQRKKACEGFNLTGFYFFRVYNRKMQALNGLTY